MPRTHQSTVSAPTNARAQAGPPAPEAGRGGRDATFRRDCRTAAARLGLKAFPRSEGFSLPPLSAAVVIPTAAARLAKRWAPPAAGAAASTPPIPSATCGAIQWPWPRPARRTWGTRPRRHRGLPLHPRCPVFAPDRPARPTLPVGVVIILIHDTHGRWRAELRYGERLVSRSAPVPEGWQVPLSGVVSWRSHDARTEGGSHPKEASRGRESRQDPEAPRRGRQNRPYPQAPRGRSEGCRNPQEEGCGCRVRSGERGECCICGVRASRVTSVRRRGGERWRA
jgi:hypothetical protein